MTSDESPGESPSEERLLRGYSGRLLIVTSIGWMTIQGGRLVLSPMLPSIIADLQITPFLAGIGLSVMWGLYALNQYPSGRLSDRLSRKTLIVTGLLFQVVGFGLFVLATTFPLYLAASAILGVGTGMYPTPARALVSDHFVEKRGRAFGLHTGFGDLGGLLASGLAVLALAVATWHFAFLPIVGILAAVALSLHRWSRESYSFQRPDAAVIGEGAREALSTLQRLGTEWRFRLILLAYSLYAFTWQSSASFLPTFLQEAKGFSPALASAGFAAMFVVGTVVKPIAGVVGDRTRKVFVAAASLVVGATALALAIFAPSDLLTILGVVGFAVGLLAYPPVMQAYLMDAFPNASMGGDLGAIRSVYITIGAIGPTYVGYVASGANYTLAFLTLVGALLASATLIVVSTRV
ncbi:MAG: MFS transporter [Halanaeroarchaeum sp.]